MNGGSSPHPPLAGLDATKLQLIEAIRAWTLVPLEPSSKEYDESLPEDRARLRHDLDLQESHWREIHRLMEQEVAQQIATIRHRRNTLLAPVSLLPTEIICSIFEYVTDTRGPLAAVTLSRVSSRWRSIAISFPKLWTQIDTSLAIPVALFLTRSKILPLDVRMSCKREMFLPLIVSHVERCRTIEITEVSPGDLDALCSRLGNPAPLLKTLALESHRFGSMISQDAGSDLQLFGGNTPLLRTLKLESFNLPPRAFSCLGGLTSLTMGFGRDGFGYRPSLERFLALLSTCPLLEQLVIHRHGPMMDLWPISHAPVKLDHIREVFLQGLPPSQSTFLSLLALPSSAVLKIGIDLSEHDDILPILQIITAGRTRHSLQNLYAVSEVTFIGGGHIAQRWALHVWTPGGNLALAFIFLNARSRSINERLFGEIAYELAKLHPKRLGFSQVNATQLSSCEPFCTVLSRLPTLTEVAIAECEPFTHEIVRYLAYTPPQGQGSPSRPVSTASTTSTATTTASTSSPSSPAASSASPTAPIAAPNLRLLSIQDSDIEPKELLELVDAPARRGVLRQLRLTECDNVNRKMIGLLRTKVAVDWEDEDGWESDNADWGDSGGEGGYSTRDELSDDEDETTTD